MTDRYVSHIWHSIGVTPLFSFVEQVVLLCLNNCWLALKRHTCRLRIRDEVFESHSVKATQIIAVELTLP
jgi:hypothetical protein